jgi:hypothetical protein
MPVHGFNSTGVNSWNAFGRSGACFDTEDSHIQPPEHVRTDMLCERCHAREATWFGEGIMQGKFDSPWLCNECKVYGMRPGLREILAAAEAAGCFGACQYCGERAFGGSISHVEGYPWIGGQFDCDELKQGNLAKVPGRRTSTCRSCSDEWLRFVLQRFEGTTPDPDGAVVPLSRAMRRDMLERLIKYTAQSWSEPVPEASKPDVPQGIPFSLEEVVQHMQEWVQRRAYRRKKLSDN